MLTYDFTNVDVPIYEYLYRCIKNDILAGNLKPGDKLPSKRSFAHNHGISTYKSLLQYYNIGLFQ